MPFIYSKSTTISDNNAANVTDGKYTHIKQQGN